MKEVVVELDVPISIPIVGKASNSDPKERKKIVMNLQHGVEINQVMGQIIVEVNDQFQLQDNDVLTVVGGELPSLDVKRRKDDAQKNSTRSEPDQPYFYGAKVPLSTLEI
ncbi:hypothetical protein V6N13_109805 [Hibiscus sabdariffa]|uniref:Ubiquitin-like domain-containing protein n=1 Tax=Hibiscus sabdariffa TaxID=183260 RepID=A0ABR2FRB6_9ROSI